jgi:hypothetical protein
VAAAEVAAITQAPAIRVALADSLLAGAAVVARLAARAVLAVSAATAES